MIGSPLRVCVEVVTIVLLKQILKILANHGFESSGIYDPISVTVFKIPYPVRILSTKCRGMVILSVPVFRFYPLFSGSLTIEAPLGSTPLPA